MEHFSAPHDGQNPDAAQLTEQAKIAGCVHQHVDIGPVASGTGLCKLIRTGSVEVVEAGSPRCAPGSRKRTVAETGRLSTQTVHPPSRFGAPIPGT